MLPMSTFSRIWNLSPSTLEGLRREFDAALEPASKAVPCDSRTAFSVWESADRVTVEVDVPGIAEADLEISIEDGVLQISGQRSETEREGELKFSEHRHAEFRRALSLHDSLDPSSVVAELENGVLTLTIARKAEAQPRKIAIGVGTKSAESTET